GEAARAHVMPHGPAKAELIRAPSTAVHDFGEAVAFWRQGMTQELIVGERAWTNNDELHDGLPRGLDVPNKKNSPLSRDFLRAVCCSDTQGRLGFPWPPKRGWAKRCATLPWPLSGWSLQFLFFLLTRRSPREGSGCQGGDPAALGSAPRGP